jgi:hypothetical protein
VTVTRVDERLSRRPLVTCAAARGNSKSATRWLQTSPGLRSIVGSPIRRPWVFLYTPNRVVFFSKRVGNYQHHLVWDELSRNSGSDS